MNPEARLPRRLSRIRARFAVPLMLKERRGLIINVSSHSAGSTKTPGSKRTLPYSVVKAALHRLTADMATELLGLGIAVISIWPPATKTEGVLAQPEVWGDLSDWNSPLFTGRVVAALTASGDVFARSGEALVVEDLARQLGMVELLQNGAAGFRHSDQSGRTAGL